MLPATIKLLYAKVEGSQNRANLLRIIKYPAPQFHQSDETVRLFFN